jgi:hypothetical protein
MISLIRQNTFPIGGTTTLCSQLKCVVGTCLLVKPASPFSVRLLTTVTVLVTGDKAFAPVLSHLRTPKGVVTVIGLQKKKQVTLNFLIEMTNSSRNRTKYLSGGFWNTGVETHPVAWVRKEQKKKACFFEGEVRVPKLEGKDKK